MDRRFLTKALWAAAAVMIAVGALGQGVLAEKPRPPAAFTAKTVVCDAGGLVVADVTIEVSAAEINLIRGLDIGVACFDLMREAAAAGLEVQMHTIDSTGGGTTTLSFTITNIDP